MSADLLDTQNVFSKSIEKILEVLQKKFFVENCGLLQWYLEVSREAGMNGFFFLRSEPGFCRYLQIGVSYDSDLKCAG